VEHRLRTKQPIPALGQAWFLFYLLTPALQLLVVKHNNCQHPEGGKNKRDKALLNAV